MGRFELPMKPFGFSEVATHSFRHSEHINLVRKVGIEPTKLKNVKFTV